MANWLQRTINSIQREYERRVRKASEVTEYGQHHEHAGSTQDEDEGAAEIMNVPRGTSVARQDNHQGQNEA